MKTMSAFFFFPALWKSDLSITIEVWIIGSLFVILAIPISLWDITHHLVHFTKPHMQKYIIRYFESFILSK